MKQFMMKSVVALAVLAWGTWQAVGQDGLPMLTHSTDGVLHWDGFENQTVTGVQGTGAPTTANISPGAAGTDDEWFVIANG